MIAAVSEDAAGDDEVQSEFNWSIVEADCIAGVVTLVARNMHNIIVLDGHMKCHRSRCGATSYEIAASSGFGQGKLRGCLVMPLSGKYFCAGHSDLQRLLVAIF